MESAEVPYQPARVESKLRFSSLEDATGSRIEKKIKK
jgi:hypothetical protein